MTNEELAMRATAVRRNIVKNVDESRIGTSRRLSFRNGYFNSIIL